MKRVTIMSILAIMLIAVLGISCSKDKVGLIPNATVIECKAGERPTISFSAGGDWQLSSDAVWCKFITSGGELQEMAGAAGQHTITLKITDDNNNNQWSVANIIMKMGDKSGIIATIKRHPKELYIKLYDVTDTPTKVMKLGYVDYVTTRIEANFRFAAIDLPEWIEVAHKPDNGNIETINAITGVPGEQTEVLMRIVNDGEREKTKITKDDGYVITLSDESGEHTFEFPIEYDGMGTDALTFMGPADNYYGWNVSLDGKTFNYNDPISGTTTIYHDELQYIITAQDDIYHILFFEKRLKRGIPDYVCYEETNTNCWMHFNKEEMTFSVDEHTGSTPRHGMVMAIPSKIYNTIRATIKESIFEYDTSSGINVESVKEDYTKYILIEFTQRDIDNMGEYDGMYAYHSLTTLEIYCEPYTDTTLAEKYETENIYVCDFVNSEEGKLPGIIVDPRIEYWTTDNYEKGYIGVEVWHGDNELKLSEGEYYIGENKDERLAIHLWGPTSGWNATDVVIVFTVNKKAEKILIVTPPEK